MHPREIARYSARVALIVLMLHVTGGTLRGQVWSQADSAAIQSGLPIARDLISGTAAAQLGFTDPSNQLPQIVLGDPLPGRMVNLAALRGYDASQDPDPLLVTTGRIAYPMMVSGVTLSAITVAEVTPGGYQVVSIGAPNLYRAVDSIRTVAGGSPTDYSVVSVPALKVLFIGRVVAGEWSLTPVFSDNRFGFVAGVAILARTALEAMVTAAIAHDGLPH